jgi:hypothetical protein
MELGSRWRLRRLVRRNFAGSQCLFCNGLQLRENLSLRALNRVWFESDSSCGLGWAVRVPI